MKIANPSNRTIKQVLMAVAVASSIILPGAVQAAAPTNTADIVGTWRNTSQTPLPGGIDQFNVSASSTGSVKVQAMGTCVEPSCLLGTAAASTFSFDPSSNTAETWTAKFKIGTASIQVVATRLPTANPMPGEFIQVQFLTTWSATVASYNDEQTATFQFIPPPPSAK